MFDISNTYLNIFSAKDDSEKELRSQIVFAKSYAEVIDDFKKIFKKNIVADESFLLKTIQIENNCIDDKHRIQKRIVEGSYTYSQQLEDLFISLPPECKDDFVINCALDDYSNQFRTFGMLIDSIRTIDLQITLYDGIDDDAIVCVYKRFKKYRNQLNNF